jgi:hypothetical protein
MVTSEVMGELRLRDGLGCVCIAARAGSFGFGLAIVVIIKKKKSEIRARRLERMSEMQSCCSLEVGRPLIGK